MTNTVTLHEGQYGGTVRRTVLGNGLRIITEEQPGARSAAFGIYVAVGSRDESVELAGASHFLEHLLFKGTKKRSAWDISSQIEAVGGDTNAYTTKEYTSFYARVLDRDLPLAIDVITDMVTNSVLDPAEMELERGVVLEEIAMTADEPDDAVHELFAEAVWGGRPLARPILGSIESIKSMPRDDLYAFYRRHYQPSTMVVSAAGRFHHEEVVEQVAAAFATSSLAEGGGSLGLRLSLPAETGMSTHGQAYADNRAAHANGSTRVSSVGGSAQASGPLVPARAKLVADTRTIVRPKDTDQAHLILGRAGIDRFDDRRYALGLLNQVLGGGMSSRLFQQVRERRGLAYSVYSFANNYADAGLIGVYAGCAPHRVRQVLDVVRDELDGVAKSGITEQELARGIGMITGGTVLGLEDTGARMGRIAKGELLYGDFLSVDDLLAKFEGVGLDEVASLAADLLNGPACVTAIGQVNESDLA